MRYRQVGVSGLTVSAIGLGCIHFGRRCNQDEARALVDQALDVGITLFDTANSYAEGASEQMLGTALGARRDRAVIATKFGSRRLRRPDQASGSRRAVRQAVEASLARLQTDYIDLLQLHFPDPSTPIEETLSALDDLVHEGKVRYVGSSNFEAWQLVEAEWVGRSQRTTRFVSTQREYSLFNREVERDVVPVCTRYGLGLLPWRPLGNGLLTGRYRRGDRLPASTNAPAPELSAADWDLVEALERFGQERGVGLLEVAIGGLAAAPAVASVMIGASRPEQVLANARALEWTPTPDDLSALRALLEAAAPAPGRRRTS